MRGTPATAPILDIAPADLREAGGTNLLGLNNAHAAELSWLSPDQLAALVGMAFMASRIGVADAMLIAFDQDAAYDNVNFRWFRTRFDRFVYVDRVVVDPARRGFGLARVLYEALFARARDAGHDRVTCEVNADPPNPASDAFHASLGFEAFGSALLPGYQKTVRYYRRSLDRG